MGEFSFAPNEFFSNSALSKVYYLADTDDCPVLDKALGTEIQWKPGKNATIRVVKRKTKNGKTAGKVITRREPCGSFFNFFSTLEIPEVHDLDLDGETFERKIENRSGLRNGHGFQGEDRTARRKVVHR